MSAGIVSPNYFCKVWTAELSFYIYLSIPPFSIKMAASLYIFTGELQRKLRT